MPDSLPPRGILYNDLITTGSEGVSTNSHGVCFAKAKIKDKEKETDIEGFFKPVSTPTNITHYPPDLAKWSIANCQMYRLFMGDNAAEELLVVHENGDIAGTFSVAAPNATPLLFSNEKKSDPQLEHYVNPSAETLTELNIAHLLMTSWFMKEDDLHAKQMLFCYDKTDEKGNYINPRFVRIDWDMSSYDKTKDIKGERFVDGYWRPVAKQNLQYTPCDFSHFPNILNGGFYWPTRPSPVTGYKEIKSCEAFQKLPEVKEFMKESGEVTSFQLQKYESALMLLLLFQPENVLKPRLEQVLSKKTESDFIQEALDYFQQNYDDFYLTTVFYRGSENNKDPAFNDFLRRRPSAYNKVVDFAKKINKEFEEQGIPGGTFDLDAIERKYFQVWRDAFQPQFYEIRLRAYNFYKHLGDFVSVSDESDSDTIGPASSIESSKSKRITAAKELFQELPFDRVAELKISCDVESSLRSAFENCGKIIPELIKGIQTYYNVDVDKLTVEQNIAMIEQLKQSAAALLEELDNVGRGTETHTLLSDLIFLIKETAKDVDLKEHKINQTVGKGDRPIDCDDKNDSPDTGKLEYNNPTVADDVLRTMYTWVNNNIDQFHQIVKEAACAYGETRNRSPHILRYIQLSRETGANQLAYIFSNGGWENGKGYLSSQSYNMHLFNLLLRKINHTSIQAELNKLGTEPFDDGVYLQKLHAFVEHQDVRHAYHPRTFPLFENTLYDWLDKQWELKKSYLESGSQNPELKEQLVFENKLRQACEAYSKNRGLFSSMVKSGSAKQILDMLNEGKSYKYIFSTAYTESKRGEHSTIFTLFKNIWDDVIGQNEELNVLYKELHGQLFFEKLKGNAAEIEKKCRQKEDMRELQVVSERTSSRWGLF